MQLSATSKLEGFIVQALARLPFITANEIQESVIGTYGHCSVQAVYQELRKLEKAGIVGKTRDRYSLRLSWVLDVQEFADVTYDTYLSATPIWGFLPEGTNRVSWKIRSLQGLIPFWTQLLLVLIHESESREFFEWAPHAIFHLVHEDEKRFIRALKSWKTEYYLAVGGNTFLDKSYQEIVVGLPGDLSFGKSPFPDSHKVYYSLIGEYLITVKLPPTLESSIHTLFRGVKSAKDIDVGVVSGITSRNEKISFTLERNPHKTKRFYGIFSRFFGLSKIR